ncbi:MAG: TetR/AcrR family transcriptional regulator, partial [Rubrivivax sp.]
FTREMMAGAPRYQDVLKAQVMPLLHADVARFEGWAAEGRIRRLDFTHLMFLIWSTTQSYADLGPQFAIYMGKPALDEDDFDRAGKLITELIWRSLEIAP